jgi:hypothetical protein
MRYLSFTVSLSFVAACATGQSVVSDDSDDDGAASTASAVGGAGGQTGAGGNAAGGQVPALPCGIDCGSIDTPDCQAAICNAETLKCEIVPLKEGTSCDDGQFCTTQDACVAGICVGGLQNDCGMAPVKCQLIVCIELNKSCGIMPAPDGSFCVAADLCAVGAGCQAGICSGFAKDCFFAPTPDDCHSSACNPQNGKCEPFANPNLDGKTCIDLNDMCSVNKTCAAGTCIGGEVKDCSALTVGCFDGICDPGTGQCFSSPVPPGGTCAQATDDCNVGICDMNGNCAPQATNEGGACNSDPCFDGQLCAGGQCQGGVVITQCTDGDQCCAAGCQLNNDSDCGCRVPSDYATVQLAANNACAKVILESTAPTTFTLTNPPGDLEIVPEIGRAHV